MVHTRAYIEINKSQNHDTKQLFLKVEYFFINNILFNQRWCKFRVLIDRMVVALQRAILCIPAYLSKSMSVGLPLYLKLNLMF